METTPKRCYALKVSLSYAAFAALWIVLSDRIIVHFNDLATAAWFGSAKGIAFVIVTAVIFYIAIESKTPYVGTGANLGIRKNISCWRLVASFIIPLIAFAIQWSCWDVVKPYVWFLFFPAVFFSSWVGGLFGGLVSTTLSTVIVWYVFIPPSHSFALENPYSAISIGVFFAMGVLFAMTHERLRRAERLASDVKFRSLVDQMLVGIYIVQDDNFRYVNPAFVAMFGYSSPSDIMDRVSVDSVIAAESREQVIESTRKWMTEENSDIALIVHGRRANGSVFPIEMRGRSFSLSGKPAVIGIVLDVAERVQAEKARRESEQLLRLALDASHTGVWAWGYADGTVFWSPGCAEVFGVSSPACLPQSLSGLAHPDDARNLESAFERVLERPEALSLEFRVLLPDGKVRWIALEAAPVEDDSGRFLRLVGTVRDVSERKLIEERLTRQADELRLRNEELERFNHAMIGRELDMIELKRQLNEMALELGRERPFSQSVEVDQNRQDQKAEPSA